MRSGRIAASHRPLVSEIFSNAACGRGMSVATAANWVSNLLIALAFLDFADGIGQPATFFL